jgi:hypothetical protein
VHVGRGAAGNARPSGRRVGREVDAVLNDPHLTVFYRCGRAIDPAAILIAVQEDDLKAVSGVAVPPGGKCGRSVEGHIDLVAAAAPASRKALLDE